MSWREKEREKEVNDGIHYKEWNEVRERKRGREREEERGRVD